MKTATTLSPNLALPSALRQALPAARVGLILIALVALGWSAQPAHAQNEAAARFVTSQSKVGPVLDPLSPSRILDGTSCGCSGNYSTVTLRSEGSAPISVEVKTSGGTTIFGPQSISQGQEFSITSSIGTTIDIFVGSSNPAPFKNLPTTCGQGSGSGAFQLNSVRSSGSTTLRVVEITGSPSVICTVAVDLEVDLRTNPDPSAPKPNPGDQIDWIFRLYNNNHNGLPFGGNNPPIAPTTDGSLRAASIDGKGVVVVLNLSSRVSVITGSLPSGCSASGTTVTCTIPTIGLGINGSLTIPTTLLGGGPSTGEDITGTVEIKNMWSPTRDPDSVPTDITASGSGCGTSKTGTSQGARFTNTTPQDAGKDDCFVATLNVLPVELTSFDALVDGRGTTLRWQTASETNNAGFEIQHRYADVSDKAATAFEALDFVAGAGTTLEAQSYSFRVDNLEPGRHVFRLKQLDYDGSFAYSPEVEVAVEMPEAFLVSAVYPNPFNPEASFSFGVRQGQQVTVSVFNMLGQQVLEVYRGRPSAGVTQTVRIDGSGLRSGTYVLRVLGERFVDTQTFTLIK